MLGIARTAAVALLGKETAFWGLGIADSTKSSGDVSSSAGSKPAKSSGEASSSAGKSDPSQPSASGADTPQREGVTDTLESEGVAGVAHSAAPEAGSASAAGSGGVSATATATASTYPVPTSSGDPSGLLPLPDHTRLVGVKVPVGPCMVRCAGRHMEEADYVLA